MDTSMRILAMSLSAPAVAATDTAADKCAIAELMRTTWERPDAPLSVDPVVVADDYAIAGWITGRPRDVAARLVAALLEADAPLAAFTNRQMVASRSTKESFRQANMVSEVTLN